MSDPDFYSKLNKRTAVVNSDTQTCKKTGHTFKVGQIVEVSVSKRGGKVHAFRRVLGVMYADIQIQLSNLRILRCWKLENLSLK